jgi:hypothetical protein
MIIYLIIKIVINVPLNKGDSPAAGRTGGCVISPLRACGEGQGVRL